MQLVHAFQMGNLHTSDLPNGVRSKVVQTSKSMTKKASGEFAAKVEEGDDIDFSVLSFREYLVVETELVEAFSELSANDIACLQEKCSMEDEEPASKKSKKDKKPEWLTKAEEKAEKKAGKLDEKWDEEAKVPESKKGMFKGKTVAELESELARLKKSGPHKEGSAEYTKEKELAFAIRAKHNWKGTK